MRFSKFGAVSIIAGLLILVGMFLFLFNTPKPFVDDLLQMVVVLIEGSVAAFALLLLVIGILLFVI